ncbi:hypothetical protein K1719_033383 [Acacia pycnantha]|nr:hypothetical protein K1719_033383 [Acacia pycnantha]
MLIRNIDQAAGMCNGTRLQISQLGKNVIKAKALNDTSIGEEILIHRMDMNPSETKIAFQYDKKAISYIYFFCHDNKQKPGSIDDKCRSLPTKSGFLPWATICCIV